MRCPHCGYNSFAHLENCKKCGRELKPVRTEAEEPHNDAAPEESIATQEQADIFTSAGVDATPAFVQESELEPETELEPEPEAVNHSHSAGFARTESGDEAGNAEISQPGFLFGAQNPQEEMDIFPAEMPIPAQRSLIGRRFFASVLDITVILTVWLLFYALGHQLLWEDGQAFFTPLFDYPRVRGGFYLLLVLIALAYFSVFHYISGQTPGKMLTRIRLVACDSEPLALSRVLLRTCAGVVSALFLGVGYIAILFARDARGWNDTLAETMVVSVASEKSAPLQDE